jgi:hypothetical protein
MKKLISISTIILFVTAGCGGDKPSTDDFITVDVTASYPKKELILQDFMDVEYIPLETNDTFLTQGFVQDINKDIIAVKNYTNDGDIFIFNRSGKGLKKINRKGEGSEEYLRVASIVMDENKGEILVNNATAKKIVVYNMNGNFKRSFKYKDGAYYSYMYDFDQENLICYDNSFDHEGKSNIYSHIIISKQDGSITEEIQIPYKEKILTAMIVKDEPNHMTYASTPTNEYSIIPYRNNWILIEPSADTIYSYSSNHAMKPFIVRIPPIRSMDPEVFLFIGILTDRYYFMAAVKKEYDFGTQNGFPRTNFMYDTQEKTIYNYTVYNDDFSNKRQVYMNSNPVNDEIASWQPLQAPDLVKAYEKGQLKGHLKEIAAGLNEESNPVIMLIKHKKQ